MSKLEEDPKKLQPYISHGVDLSWGGGDKEALGECVWCGDPKFSVDIKTGRWKCWSCRESGNIPTFIVKLWKESDKATTDYKELIRDRKIQTPETLFHWGVCRSVITDIWLIPGYDVASKLQQLYRYVKTAKGMRLLPTKSLGHKIHGMNLFDITRKNLIICEGPWDAMVLWETLGQYRYDDDNNLVPTANKQRSLLADTNVIAIPGCNTFFDGWTILAKDRNVTIMFDSDHPKSNPKTGKAIAPAGFTETKKLANKLINCKTPPESVSYLDWGKEGYDLDLPSGTDVRDILTTIE